MVGTIVLDASAAVALLVREGDSDAAATLFVQAIGVFAPDLLRVEVANALWSKVRLKKLSPAAAKTALINLDGLGITWQPLDAEILNKALELALILEHPVYDCLYVSLAQSKHAQLLTLDRRFLKRLEPYPYLANLVVPLV